MLRFFFRQVYKNKEIIKYFIAGGTAAFVDLLLLYIFTDIIGFWYLHSAILAFIVAFFVSFSLQKFWTFRDNSREKIHKQMIWYFIVAGANLGLNAGGMFILVDKWHIMYLFAQVIMGGLIAGESFLIYKFFIFSRGDKISFKKNENIRVLIATGIYPPAIGGPATYAQSLSQELLKLGCEVKIISYGENKRNPKKNSNLYIIEKSKNIFWRYLRYFWRAGGLASWADVVYILDLVSAGFPAVTAASLKGKKIILRTGGDFLWEKAFESGWTDLPLAQYYKTKKSFRETLYLYFCRSLLEAIDLVIFSSSLQRDIYRDYYGLEDKKVRMVANAIPQISIAEKDNSYENALVFAGRLIKLKNLERLLRAFSMVNNEKAKLFIFGNGPQKDKLRQMIANLHLASRVEIKESVEHDALLKIIAGCQFVILPSLTEISPNLALECLSMAKPIVLTKYTGLDYSLMEHIVKVDPLSEDNIKEKIEYLLKPDNLADYENKLRENPPAQRSWQEVAQEHLVIFKEFKKNNG